MRRVELARAVAEHLGPDAVVVCGLGSTSRAWMSIDDLRPTYYASDPMGLAPSIAFGFALAAPDQEVALLEGDGDLLMALASLATIAAEAPPNLKIVVFNNGIYETGGRRPLAVSEDMDIAAVGRAVGIDRSDGVADAGDVDALLQSLFAQSELGLVVVPVDPEESPYGDPPQWSQAEMKGFFLRSRQDQ